jgi:carboxyl-terminal processing protease
VIRPAGSALLLCLLVSAIGAQPIQLLQIPDGNSQASSGNRPSAGYSPPDLEAAYKVTGVKNDSVMGCTFNTFWADLDNRYAVFAERLPTGKTWAQLGQRYGKRVNGKMSSTQLFDALIGMVRELDDGHTSLKAKDLDRDEDAAAAPYKYEDELDGIESNVKARYVEEKRLTSLARGKIKYGRIAGPVGKGQDVGYVLISSMEGLSPGGTEDADTAVTRQAMRTILGEFGDVLGVVLDVRNNGGGFDDVSKEIAGWFKGPHALAWKKQHREGRGFSTPEKEYVVDSSKNKGAFVGPTVLLQSGASFSAAETLGLALRTREQVTFVGEPTGGHYSDTYGFESEAPSGAPGDGQLPNGWTYQFSGEIYVSADGKIREAIGIPVKHPVRFDPKALARGQDVMLDRALAVLRGAK